MTFCSLTVMTFVSQLLTVGRSVDTVDVGTVSVLESEVLVPLVFIDSKGYV